MGKDEAIEAFKQDVEWLGAFVKVWDIDDIIVVQYFSEHFKKFMFTPAILSSDGSPRRIGESFDSLE